MEDWRKRIESEPLRVLAEVAEESDVEFRSRKTDGFPATAMQQQVAAHPQATLREETGEPARKVVAGESDVEFRSRPTHAGRRSRSGFQHLIPASLLPADADAISVDEVIP
jgi:hypothetical protein